MEPEEALHFHILRRKKEGVEDWIDKSVEKIGAVPTLNEVLLPAMKEVGDKFGAGELILPFVLQSAEVMKRAVAQLENYLERIEGHTKGKVVIATVFGDVHDIGKSLVNTILTNNGYTVIDLGKQVPVDTIINAAVEHEADAIGLSALLVSTSKQMPICVQELHERGHEFPVLIGGAAINRDFGRRILYPKGKESDEVYEPGVFYCKDAFAGPGHDGPAGGRRGARSAGGDACAPRPRTLREKPVVVDDSPPVTDDSVRSAARTDTPIPEPPFWGAREIEVDLDDVYPYLDRHVLFKLHWGGRGEKGEEWERLVRATARRRASRRGSSACGASRTTCARARSSATSPATPTATSSWSSIPSDHDKELERLSFPRQPKHDRICLSDFFRPIDVRRARRGRPAGRDRRPRGHRADGQARERRRVRRAALHPRPRRPVRRGPGRVAARGGAPRAGHRPRPGPPLLVGLPGLPGPVRAREGLAPARPRRDRHVPLGRASP